MKYFILAQILFLTSLVGYAQQVMLADSVNKNPVSYATVYDANGTVIGRSDMGGYIHLQKGFEYHISHISYESKSLVYNEDSIIFLSPLSYKISEVNVGRNTRVLYRHQKQKGALRKCRNELLHVEKTGHCTEETEYDDCRQVHGSSVS